MPEQIRPASVSITAWVILIACLLAIPVGIFCKPQKTSDPKPTKRWSSLLNQDRLLVVKLNGAIYDDDDDSDFIPNFDSPTYVKKQIRKAVEDDNVKGLLIRINSPGGTVGMSQEIYDAVKSFRSKGRPVVVSMGDVAASGGYYIAAAADQIFANPGTLTGSIGVIMHLLNWQETEKKLGLQPIVIKSGQFKDIGSADRAMTPEEKNLLQAIISDSYDQFVTAVSAGRKMDKEAVKKLADGRIYSGRQAHKVKLVDQLGGYDDALAYLQKTAKDKYKLSKDLPLDEGPSFSIFSSLFGSSSSSASLGLGKHGLLKGIVPDWMNPSFNKQPLWIMM